MTKKIIVSVCAAALVGGVNAYAFSFGDSGSSCGFGGMGGMDHSMNDKKVRGSMHGGMMGNGGGVDYGFHRGGGYICFEGFSWMGSASMGISFGSASGCNDDDFDFYYKTFGGFIADTGDVSSPNFKPGTDDVDSDGFWYREGEFSAPVYYGDPENDGKRYADDPNGAWPAWTWGHPEADPFISASGSGDDLGGAAGIGLGGFGMGEGNKIKAGDDAAFYPLNFMGVNNFRNSSFGTYASDVSWNVVIYDKNHKEVFKKNYTTTAYYWETLNYQNSKYGIICPRTSVEAGETINDLTYNSAIHNDITSRWPIMGLDIDFIGDGKQDMTACADAIKLKDQLMSDTFTVKKHPFMPGKKYELVFEGPYIYDASGEDCPAINEEGLPDTLDKWSASCFKRVDTIWAHEADKTRAFMRMTLKEVKHENNNCHMKPVMPDVDEKQKEKAKDLLHKMIKKCNTTIEKVQKNIKEMNGCAFNGSHG